MLRRTLAIFIAALVILCSSAFAEGLPTVSDEKGEAAAFTAAATEIAAPEAGDWDLYVRSACGLDEATLDSFRTQIAIKATEMEFNSYAAMSYAEKASVVVACADYTPADFAHSFYGEGDAAANNAVLPANVAPGGDFAVFTLKDGAWTGAGTFALANDASGTDPYYLVDLSCYDIGEAPAYLAWYDAAGAAWHVVGVNQAYVDTLIGLAF